MKGCTLVKDSLTNIQNFDGVAGKLSFNETENPSKCTVVAKNFDKVVFTFQDWVCPLLLRVLIGDRPPFLSIRQSYIGRKNAE